MTSYKKLIASTKKKNTMLCVGLDVDMAKIPSKYFSKDINGLYDFNKTIIEQTQYFTAGYKINFAFYEQYGRDGFNLIGETLKLISTDIFTIADAKRGDIGNTSAAYSKSVFNHFNFDSMTVNPYMGFDSIDPFVDNRDKLVFLLALTSNDGANDFQRLISDNKPIYQHIIEKSAKRYNYENIGFVVGATHPKELEYIRKLIPDNPILIPGVGTQGGDIQQVKQANNDAPALINVSRAIIYPNADDSVSFAEAIQVAVKKYV